VTATWPWSRHGRKFSRYFGQALRIITDVFHQVREVIEWTGCMAGFVGIRTQCMSTWVVAGKVGQNSPDSLERRA